MLESLVQVKLSYGKGGREVIGSGSYRKTIRGEGKATSGKS